jgi:hypothetical protein
LSDELVLADDWLDGLVVEDDLSDELDGLVVDDDLSDELVLAEDLSDGLVVEDDWLDGLVVDDDLSDELVLAEDLSDGLVVEGDWLDELCAAAVVTPTNPAAAIPIRNVFIVFTSFWGNHRKYEKRPAQGIPPGPQPQTARRGNRTRVAPPSGRATRRNPSGYAVPV